MNGNKLFCVRWSEALKGFYASHIIVMAEDKDAAKEKIRLEAKRLLALKDPDYENFEDIYQNDYIKHSCNDYEWEDIDERVKWFEKTLENDLKGIKEVRDCIFIHHS